MSWLHLKWRLLLSSNSPHFHSKSRRILLSHLQLTFKKFTFARLGHIFTHWGLYALLLTAWSFELGWATLRFLDVWEVCCVYQQTWPLCLPLHYADRWGWLGAIDWGARSRAASHRLYLHSFARSDFGRLWSPNLIFGRQKGSEREFLRLR